MAKMTGEENGSQSNGGEQRLVMEVEETTTVVETVVHKDVGGSSQLDSIKELLDDVEDQIEQVRAQAEHIIEEKEDIQTTLEMLTNQDQLTGLSEVDKEEVKVVVERLNSRLNSVNVNLSTSRTSAQQDSLHSVNRAIDTLIFQIQTDTVQAHLLCSQYLSAAGSDIDHPADVKFEQHLLGCTAEDQKNVKKRLLGLLDHIKVLAGNSITESE
eukprot:TRINITY_DN50751_c0_g1_i1.p1 TRINITY_DN50751_c0_g1~~TRINITY_DN50751_c0_g1_i1.p1  ORF type:complete len:213 (+),score=74.44 TRINITY_DN50751_c0_g1_i1:39-677(+)